MWVFFVDSKSNIIWANLGGRFALLGVIRQWATIEEQRKTVFKNHTFPYFLISISLELSNFAIYLYSFFFLGIANFQILLKLSGFRLFLLILSPTWNGEFSLEISGIPVVLVKFSAEIFFPSDLLKNVLFFKNCYSFWQLIFLIFICGQINIFLNFINPLNVLMELLVQFLAGGAI